MSEKRHRQQQRRQQRKAQGRTRSTGAPREQRSSAARTAELEEILRNAAAISARDARDPADALEAEQWGSCTIDAMSAGGLPGQDVRAMVLPGFIAALEQLGTCDALATLRALAAVCPPEHADGARAAGDRLAGAGLLEPSWAADLGHARPTAAALLCDEAFDDGMSVMIEFTTPNVETHTIGVYVDHNLGGLVKDVFLAGPLSEVRGEMSRAAPDERLLTIRDLDLAEARARVEAALHVLDDVWDPPVDDDVRALRALIEARMRLLPDGYELPDHDVEVTPEERDALLDHFLSSPEGRRWRGDDDAEEMASLAIDFGAGYNHGGPLRWSPVVVEIFMTSWLTRKVGRELEFFERVPAVLADWVKYAGRRKSLSAEPLREAVAAVENCSKDMLDAVNDPAAWGPAKAFAVAALEAGVDLTDRDEVERFIERYNDSLAA